MGGEEPKPFSLKFYFFFLFFHKSLKGNTEKIKEFHIKLTHRCN